MIAHPSAYAFSGVTVNAVHMLFDSPQTTKANAGAKWCVQSIAMVVYSLYGGYAPTATGLCFHSISLNEAQCVDKFQYGVR